MEGTLSLPSATYTIREAREGEAVLISEVINSAFAESDNWYKKPENQCRVNPDGSAHPHLLSHRPVQLNHRR
jgi:hypothetical protein